jgi:integrase
VRAQVQRDERITAEEVTCEKPRWHVVVFCRDDGEGRDYHDAGEAYRAAVKGVGLKGRGRLTLHSLRYGFARLSIALGPSVVFVSRQLGHASPATTVKVYAHLFQQADHAVAAREALQASYEAMAGSPTVGY